MSKVYNLKPHQYIHILDKNENKKKLIEGPLNYAPQDHEIVIDDRINDMIIISFLGNLKITNPVERDSENKIVLSKFGLPKNKWGTSEIRTRENWGFPFPLYPGELLSEINEMAFINQDVGLHIKAVIEFNDNGTTRLPGDEWLVRGPCYFYLKPEMELVRQIESFVITKPNALRLMARKNFTTPEGVVRVAGEEWLIYEEGRYLPSVNEEVKKEVAATILNDNAAIHLKALNNFTDIYGIKRNAGEEWIITKEISSFHTCGIYEEVTKIIKRTVLDSNEYILIENPFDETTRKNQLGAKKLVKGATSFFLNPGEVINQIEKVYVLTETEALLLQAIETFEDESKNVIQCGQKWMIKGPTSYIPPIHVRVIEPRKLICLDKNEGIYIRNKNTGEVRIHMGSSYLLQPNEVLWEKQLSPKVEKIYLNDMNLTMRDKTRIVSYKCPFNAIMQIYNLKDKSNRIVVGPNLAILKPDEDFCLMSLSGKTPKVEGVVETLYLKIGPIFSTDEFSVETSDHTRLILKLGYNWRLDVSGDEKENIKIFSVRDFVGVLCSNMASKIRSSIATIKFEDFHKNSDNYIKKAVFGEKDGVIQSSIRFNECKLVVNDVDIKTVTPSDPSTQELLQKSVALAIQLTTKTIEQEFNSMAKIKEQEYKGEIAKLQISNQIEFLKKNILLNSLKVESGIIEKTGLSRAQAMAKRDADLIVSRSLVDLSKKEKEAQELENNFDLTKKIMVYDNEYLRKSKEQAIDLHKIVELNQIESSKFRETVECIGPETLVEIAKSGPELQSKLLQGLNLSGYILTDGNNPINLFNVADSLVKK